MSRQPPALSPVEVQGAQFMNDYLNHPDYRLVAAFFLGWVFFSGLRHVWFSAFLRELMWHCKAIFDRLRARSEEPATSVGRPHEKSAGTHQSALHTEDLSYREQRDTLILLLCMAFMLAGLSSFLSQLSFYPSRNTSACAFVVAATAVASQAARVFGLLILSLDLKRFMSSPGELRIFWILLLLGTVLSGVTVGTGTGQLATPLAYPSVTLCFRKRSLATSLSSSFLNITLELYIIIRSLFLLQPPRLKSSIVQDARTVQAGSLLLFDLLVAVPNAAVTPLIAEFVPYSIGALGVLAAFNSSFNRVNSVPTQSNGPSLSARSPSRAVRAPELPTHEGDISDRVIRIDDLRSSANCDENCDIETQASPSQGLRGNWVLSTSNGVHDAITISHPQPIEVSVRRMIVPSSAPPVVQWEPGNRLRREKILSYSSPVWEAFGSSQRDESRDVSTRPQISIEATGSPTSSTGHSPERIIKVASTSSTILGSDIIRGTSQNVGKDRMRVRRSAAGLRLSQASSIPSSSRRVTQHSWASRKSAYRSTAEDTLPPRSIQPKETVLPSSWRHSQSLKSKPGSSSSRSSKSQKSSSSMRSTKVVVTIPTEGIPPSSTWIGPELSMHPARLSQGSPVSPRGERAGFVRGPRPPPFASRTRREGPVESDGNLDHRLSMPAG